MLNFYLFQLLAIEMRLRTVFPLVFQKSKFATDMSKVKIGWNIHSYRYFLPIQTRIADNDLYNHINNAVYHCYADTIINSYLVWYCGLDIKTSDNNRYMVDTKCTYRRPMTYPQPLLAGFCVTNIGKSSVHYRVAFFEPKRDYMGLIKPSQSTDPHLRLGLGSQGLLVTEKNKEVLIEMEKCYSSEASVLSDSVHVFVDNLTQRPVDKLPDAISGGLSTVYTKSFTSNL